MGFAGRATKKKLFVDYEEWSNPKLKIVSVKKGAYWDDIDENWSRMRDSDWKVMLIETPDKPS